MRVLLLIFVFLSFNIGFSQNITAKIIDASTQEAVPFATIQTGAYQGVISNEEGFFTLNLEGLETQEILISCLGYTSKSISIEDLSNNDFMVSLEPFIDALGKVFLSTKTPNADTIIKKVNTQLAKNYKNENQTVNFFHRTTAYTDFDRFQAKVTKASGMRKKDHEGVNASLDSLTQVIVNSNTLYFQDYLGDLMVENSKNAKLNVYKATSLLDKSKNFSIDNVQTKAQDLILKYLDTTLTYKLKTGIIKVEDSLALKSDTQDKTKKADTANVPTYNVKTLKGDTHGLLHDAQTYQTSFLKNIINPELYKYKFVDVTSFNSELVYVIDFEPRKSKSKYTGKLYIADETFAVLKLDYNFAKGKRGESFNLKLILGIKYVENIRKGTIIFQRHSDSTYTPKYIIKEEGRYFYVNRPLKFIENSNDKHKVAFNFIIEGSAKTKQELFIIKRTALNHKEFTMYKELEEVPYQKLKRYDPSIWKTYNAIEPLEEMKRFKGSD